LIEGEKVVMKDNLTPVCLLLGSNVAPEHSIQRALTDLGSIFQVISLSNVWQTPPIGSEGANFLNVALLIHTSQETSLLKRRFLRPLEAKLGRVRTADKFSPRTIDIDIISRGERSLDPNLWKYVYAAVPVAQLLPNLRSPESAERLESVARRLMQHQPISLRADLSMPVFPQALLPWPLSSTDPLPIF
jgi:2-amino-4-hydroxy-6-hydroxymethyldihydropteridine diphosphokinase